MTLIAKINIIQKIINSYTINIIEGNISKYIKNLSNLKISRDFSI